MRRVARPILFAWLLLVGKPCFAAGTEPEKPILVLDAGGHTAVVRKVLFTPNGKEIVTVSADKTVRVWDVASGDTLRVLRLPVGPGDEGVIDAVAVSPDGKLLAVGGMPYGRGKFGVLLYLLNLKTGHIESTLKGHRQIPNYLAFSPNGKLLASASSDKTVNLYDVKTGKIERTLEGHTDHVLTVAWSPDGQRLATSSADKTGRIWSLKTGKTLAELKGHSQSALGVAWSPDGKTVATSSSDGTVRLWEPDGKERKTIGGLPGDPLQVISIAFSRDSKELLFTGVSDLGHTGVLDLESGKTRLEFKGHTNTVVHGSVSPDGTLAATTGGNDHETFVWKIADGTVVQKLVGKGQTVWGAGWLRDGLALGWGNSNFFPRGKEFSALERSFRVQDLEFGPTPDDTFLRAETKHGRWTLKLAPKDFQMLIVDGEREKEVQFLPPTPNERVYCYSVWPGDRAVVGTAFGLYLADLKTNKILRTFVGHTGIVLTVAPAPDDRYFVTGSTDQTLRVWDPDQAEPVLSVFAAGTEWIAWTPEGYYAASADGERLIGWQVNHGPTSDPSYYPAGQFRKSLYRPDVIKLVLPAGGAAKALAQIVKDKPGRGGAGTVAEVLPPTVAITAPVATGEVRVNQAKLEVQATARSVGKNPVTALRLLLDGRPYQGEKGVQNVAAPKVGEAKATWSVELTPGRHLLAVQAESAVSKAVSRPMEVVFLGADDKEEVALPDLHILAVGISDYEGEMKLGYAAADADLITEALKSQVGKAFHKVDVKLIKNKQATRKEILAGLTWLTENQKPLDVGVLFFSGHGARDPAGQFYLVPVDVDPENPLATLVSGDVLKKSLENTPGRLVAILDACHSGSAGGKKGARPAADDLVRDLVTEDYGVVVMSSSLGREYSLEDGVVKHGYFTLALVEGLAGQADFNKDGVIHLSELDLFAFRRVRDLSRNEQHPVTAKPATVRSFPLARP
jgi:WD40 repeat protein